MLNNTKQARLLNRNDSAIVSKPLTTDISMQRQGGLSVANGGTSNVSQLDWTNQLAIFLRVRANEKN